MVLNNRVEVSTKRMTETNRVSHEKTLSTRRFDLIDCYHLSKL